MSPMNDDDFTPKPIVARVLPFVIVFGIICLVGVVIFSMTRNDSSSTADIASSTADTSSTPPTTSSDPVLDYCDFLNPALMTDANGYVLPGPNGYVLGCDAWSEKADGIELYGLNSWNWAGQTMMIGTNNPPCKSLGLTFYPNTWAPNSVKVISDDGSVTEVQIGPPESKPVDLELPLKKGLSQFRLDFDKTWSPLAENEGPDSRHLSNVTIISCKA